MALDQAFERALRSTDPVNELRSFATRLFAEGRDKGAVLGLFEKVRQELRQAGREAGQSHLGIQKNHYSSWPSSTSTR